MENEEENPLLEHEEEKDDDDDTTHPFQPGGSSTPGEEIPLTTMNREKEKDPYTDETSFIEGNPLSRVLTSNAKAWESLTREFPDANAIELEAAYSKTGKLQVKMFGQGKKAYPLFTKDKNTGEQRLNPILPKEIKSALGTEREILIAQKEKEIEKLQESIREDEEIANDENEQPSIRERAQEKIAEKLEQIDALENERDELEERVSLREKVKNIFKKYGFTVAAVFLAVGTVIGVIVNSLNKRAQNRRRRSRKRTQGTWKKDRGNTSRSYWSNSQLYFQNRWIGNKLPRQKCLAPYSWCCCVRS